VRRYLLDTSVLSAFLLGRPGAVSLVNPWIAGREAATSILVFGEVVEYLKGRSDYARRYGDLRDLVAEITPYFLTYAIVALYADIRRQLRPPHGPGLIGDIDTLIAATAIHRNLTVVTIDPDFERVSNLKVLMFTRSQLIAN
jgi:predicted nucleic acid-binding protein